MSRPRYDWWSYVKGMIRRYPAMAETPMEDLTPVHRRERSAVQAAIEETERKRTGAERMKVIRLVLWDRSHTLEGAAMEIPCHYKTAQEWHREFIQAVAVRFGLLDS